MQMKRVLDYGQYAITGGLILVSTTLIAVNAFAMYDLSSWVQV
jgi:hypothetical protein